MLQQQHHNSRKSIGIDNLVKNIINKKQKYSHPHDSSSAELEKIMSAMNENEFDQNQGQVAGKSIGSPSSPSSLSSASSTTSNHSSSSSNQSAAIQAAVQALLQQQSMGLLTQQSQDNNKSNTLAAMQQQQQLNTLLASIAAAQQQQQGSANPSTNALLNNLMQQQLDASSSSSSSKKAQKLPKLNVKTNHSQKPRAQKGNSVSPPGTSSSCSDQDVHSPSDMAESVKADAQEAHNIKQENDQEYDLDRSTNSSASHDLQNQTESQENLEDELDDYETSFQDSKRHRNHSGSSPTRSTSSNQHSRSTSPSTTSYHDSPAAFPMLNPLDSATAMLGGLNCTPGSFIDTPVSALTESIRKRRPVATDANNKKIKAVPADKKDDAYWERRRKNNEAAKRSRDLRRQKEDDIAVKATVLEQENLKLKAQVTILKAELSKLHFMLYNR